MRHPGEKGIRGKLRESLSSRAVKLFQGGVDDGMIDECGLAGTDWRAIEQCWKPISANPAFLCIG